MQRSDYVDNFVGKDGDIITVEGRDRAYYYSLVVYENAESFSDFEELIISANTNNRRNVSDSWYHYAYILHDKDSLSLNGYNSLRNKYLDKGTLESFEDQYKLVPEPERNDLFYAFKRPHYHAVLAFQNQKSWNFIKNHFRGAHLERCVSVGASYAYLTHNTPQAIKQGKYQYPAESVITDSLEYFSKVVLSSVVRETFNPSDLLKYVFVDGTNDAIMFMARFGLQQYQRYRASILDACRVYVELYDRCAGKIYCGLDENGIINFFSEKEMNGMIRNKSIFC